MFKRWFKSSPAVLLAVPFYKQDTTYTCGPVSLQMVLEFFGRRHSEKELSQLAKTEHLGTAHGEMVRAVTALGLYCYVNSDAALEEVKYFLNLGQPVIVNFIEPSSDEGHYAVAVGYDKRHLILHDPWNGPYFRLSFADFVRRWYDDGARRSHHWLMAVADRPFNLGRQYFPSKQAAVIS